VKALWKSIGTAVLTAGLLSGTAAVGGDAAAPAPAAKAAPAYREFVLGNPKASVTVIEYASLTCPHCAAFHQQVWPEFKKTYVDTGKIRFVYRDYPLDQLAFAAAVLARCAPGERGPVLIEMMFKNQSTWARSPSPLEPLRSYAQLAGMSAADVDACLKNQEIIAAVRDVQNKADTLYRVTATPTFYVGDEKLEGEPTMKNLSEMIDKQLD
jgi:protein-disulfide isomerase